MAITTEKPSQNAEEFIAGAKADSKQEQTISKKDKTFLLRIPHHVWHKARIEAFKEEETLHNYILEALAAKVSKL